MWPPVRYDLAEAPDSTSTQESENPNEGERGCAQSRAVTLSIRLELMGEKFKGGLAEMVTTYHT